MWKAVELIAQGESKHDGERVRHEVLHDGITDGCVCVVINSFGGEVVVGVFEFGVAVVNVSGNEEAVAVYLLLVIYMEGMEIIGKEFWDGPVQVWLVWGDEAANKLGIVLKLSLGEMA